MAKKKSSNAIIFGVAGRMAKRNKWNPTVVRVIWFLFALTGIGLIIYLLLALLGK